MSLKKIKLSIRQGKKHADPQKIFNKLTLRGSIENIWQPQAEALAKWDEHRSDSDVVVQMNTGGGKTLVGLLIAQSITNETNGKVLYVCPNNQLVEQIVNHAKEVGLTPASRYKSVWSGRRDFETGNTFCVTNYASVFNGRSIFQDEDITALIFDDAHVAENVIRGQFTLKIPRAHDVFGKVLHLFREYFTNSSQAERFEDITSGRFTPVLFVPMFIAWECSQQLRRLLVENGIADELNTKFAWEHIKEHLNRCVIIADGNSIEITPSVLPLSELHYFQSDVRRVYLTATLPSRASFIRTFGVSKPTIIQPSGRSGDAQRLFVFVPGETDDDQREEALSLVEEHKCCIISPSSKKGSEWSPPSYIYNTDSGQDEIDRFKKSTEPEKLGLIARYDGIDLPGNSCRLLILDRLPSGENLLNRFIDEGIRIETIRISNTATRVVQAIGRIFRSNTDHGVVLLVGPRLQSWIRSPKNRSYLPTLLQKQVLLATELAKEIEDERFTWEELIEGILEGHENWDEMYREYIDQFETDISEPEADWHIDLILEEQEAYEQLWEGQFHIASDKYDQLSNHAKEHDHRLSAWYRHWKGLALLCNDDKQDAFYNFTLAANSRSELGRPSGAQHHAFKLKSVDNISTQAHKLANWYRKKKTQIDKTIRQINKDLIYGPETNKAEEACLLLGKALGLDTKRPDKEKDTGPDVVWEGETDLSAFGFELKTDKDKEGEYFKKDISQCHDCQSASKNDPLSAPNFDPSKVKKNIIFCSLISNYHSLFL